MTKTTEERIEALRIRGNLSTAILEQCARDPKMLDFIEQHESNHDKAAFMFRNGFQLFNVMSNDDPFTQEVSEALKEDGLTAEETYDELLKASKKD